jgi:hypothetical protein
MNKLTKTPTLDARALCFNNKILPNSLHSHPWMDNLIEALPSIWESITPILLASVVVNNATTAPLPRITVRVGGAPAKKWYGFTLGDMQPDTVWWGSQDFVGWLPVNETTLLPYAGTYSIASGEMVADSDHYGSLSIVGLQWNMNLVKAKMIMKEHPTAFDSMLRHVASTPKATKAVEQLNKMLSDRRNWYITRTTK